MGAPLRECDATWLREFQGRLAARRVPITGMIELTSRCNLRCIHCYLGPQEIHWQNQDQEADTAKVLALIDELAEAGCLYLAITGGDPMIRRDFAVVYRHARERGLIVTILCNGTRITDDVLALFKEYPPASVEVSLYGATKQTYEAVTKVPGSYVKCINGIERLLAAGVSVALKTVIITTNVHELDEMQRMADQWGVTFRSDSAIFPQLTDQGKAPLALRVAPQEAVRREFSDPKSLDKWAKHLDALKGGPPPADQLYVCGAGVTSFYIDPRGQASPCIMTTRDRHSTAERSFSSLWGQELVQLRRRKAERADYGCSSCEMHVACAGCPAFNEQENGREDVKSQYVCETTQARWEALRLVRTRPRPEPMAEGAGR